MRHFAVASSARKDANVAPIAVNVPRSAARCFAKNVHRLYCHEKNLVHADDEIAKVLVVG